MTDPNRGQEWKPLTRVQLDLYKDSEFLPLIFEVRKWRVLVERMVDADPVAADNLWREARRRLEESK